MRQSYRAILHGDRIEWIDAPPDHPNAIPIEILMETGPLPQGIDERRAALANALEALAQSGGVTSIPDPVEWQRELRRQSSFN